MRYIFVEGDDDEIYFKSLLGNTGGEFYYISYAAMQDEKINSFIHSINCIPDSDYIFFADEDGKGIARKVAELSDKYSSIDTDKIIIVQYEIESWYYAGLSNEESHKLKMKHYQYDTNTLTKEQFNAKLRSILERKIILIEIMRRYSVTLAKSRNKSFADFSANFEIN